ncbi:MAG: hypothetical protein MZV63_33530 [Marinilabiliales bacterium]|nr:hypothetical protein [Marinilabiliales bacterium]
MLRLRGLFNQLFDVDKHYQRKEYLLFPLPGEAGRHRPAQGDVGQARRDPRPGQGEQRGAARSDRIGREELLAVAEILLHPALQGIDDMTAKRGGDPAAHGAGQAAATDDWQEIIAPSPANSAIASSIRRIGHPERKGPVSMRPGSRKPTLPRRRVPERGAIRSTFPAGSLPARNSWPSSTPCPWT